jgi:hypothetical protein
MKQAILLTIATTVAFLLLEAALGFRVTTAIGFGVTIVTGSINALTFLWLWWTRATPLALGMTISWLGQASFSGWWYLFSTTAKLDWLSGSALIYFLLSLKIVGGGLHIVVMQRSMELRRVFLVWPVLAALFIAVATMAVT